MKIVVPFCLLFITNFSIAQSLTGLEVLDKAIQYHDPQGNWSSFNGALKVTMQTPNSSDRISTITLNLPKQYFHVTATKDNKTIEYTVSKDKCIVAFNGKTNFTEALAKKHGLNCDRAHLYKNYYTYLYGLPMKLKDAGTKVHEKVTQKTFKGKEYLVVKVTYDEAVGSDVWYFYFNPKTFAMEVYQFFKTDDNGKVKPKSGEYILLTEAETIQGIKMPKNRAWYYNKDNGYLGTDILRK